MAENLNKPGVYRGQQKLATQQDLALLRQEIRQLIAGPISEISENGYIPWKYNNDGSLDIDYLFPEMVQSFRENTGLTITRNGISFANNIKSINFAGNYVFLDIDENGNLIVDIRPPKQEASRFNEIDGVTDSILRIRNEILSGAIIPDDSSYGDHSMFGDWEPGSIHEYFNWNRSLTSDNLVLSTNEGVFASDQNSYFEIAVFDAYGTVIATYTTKSIAGNKSSVPAQSSGSSMYVTVNISNFKEESNGFTFIPEFKFNLVGIFGSVGGRFHIKIIHHDGIFHNSYISKDYLYNIGKVPVIGNHTFQLISDSSLSGKSKVLYCSGIKYLSDGKVNLVLNNISNLNNLAAVADKIKYEFELANQNVVKESESFEGYNLDLYNTCDWKTTLYLNDDTFSNTQTSGYAILKNAFGESEQYNISISILLNSKKDNPISDKLNEYFTDESFRVKNTFERANGGEITSWDSSKSLLDYDEGTGLMITPGNGLSFPKGDWTSFLPTGSPNYDNYQFLAREKYFSRIFTGNDKLKLGGKFIFKGITKNDIFDTRFSCIISPDQGETWYSIKHVRGTKTLISRDDGTGSNFFVTGILTDIKDIENGVEVSWAYPSTMCSKNPIWFKLGLKQTSTMIIKSISLINVNDEKEW